jgi:hypothetical protein
MTPEALTCQLNAALSHGRLLQAFAACRPTPARVSPYVTLKAVLALAEAEILKAKERYFANDMATRNARMDEAIRLIEAEFIALLETAAPEEQSLKALTEVLVVGLKKGKTFYGNTEVYDRILSTLRQIGEACNNKLN